jgi:dihydrofolate synthase / folylpolyglutamate synthase
VAAGTAARDATWFDVLTAAAFDAFAAARLAWAVIEVGLGGRLDSTNVKDGEVCVVTNIDLEHTAILGATRAAIAAEKAGILKPGCTALTGVDAGDAEVAPVLVRAAAEAGAELRFVPQQGSLAQRNAALAAAALDALGERGVCEAGGRRLAGGLAGPEPAGLPGRLERRSLGGVPVVLDGAHVPSSLRAVLDELAADPGLPGRPVVVIGMGRDKDAHGLLKALAGRSDRVLCTSAGAGPYRTPGELLAVAVQLGLEAAAVSDPKDALQAALRRAQSGGWVLVTGSLHLVGAVRGLFPPAPEDPAC